MKQFDRFECWLFGLAIGCFVGMVVGFYVTTNALRCEAVEAGAGVWRVDDLGHVSFEWRQCNTETTP